MCRGVRLWLTLRGLPLPFQGLIPFPRDASARSVSPGHHSWSFRAILGFSGSRGRGLEKSGIQTVLNELLLSLDLHNHNFLP